MKRTLLASLAFATLGIATSARAAIGDGIADYTYDPITGQLSVLPDGESIWSMNFTTDANTITTFLPTPQWAFADFGDSIEWSDQFAGAFPITSDFVLGTLTTGLGVNDFEDVLYFTTVDFDTHIGAVSIAGASVPEPASLALLAVGGAAALARRRVA